jgi:hypothetical protein
MQARIRAQRSEGGLGCSVGDLRAIQMVKLQGRCLQS